MVGDLADLGLSFNQLQRLADDFGIEILANGRLVGGALEQLRQEILAASEAAFRFKEGLFSDRVLFQQLQGRLAGADQTAEERLRQQLAAAKEVGATAITEAFGGIDLGDADAVRAASQELLKAWREGEIALKDLGSLSREDFIAILPGAADALDELSGAAEEAARQMINVPAGFRQAELAFEAQDPGAAMRRLNLPLVNVTGAGSDGASLPAAIAEAIKKADVSRRVFNIAVTINGANKSGDQLFAEITAAADRAAAAGDPASFTARGD